MPWGRGERAAGALGAREQVLGTIISIVGAAASAWFLVRLARMLDPTRPDSHAVSRKKREIASRLGRPGISMNQYEDVIALDVINPDDIDVSFDDVGGLESTKEALAELVVDPFRRPELFSGGSLLRPVKGVLLYGPPGTWKTMLARAVAHEASACFINIKASTLQSKWFGDAQKLVHAVFTLAWKLAPAIIFIDEVDAFLSARKSTDFEAVNTMKTEFMSMWDGMLTRADALVTVLAATNRPWDVDEAILRRLPRSFEVPLPGTPERAGILRSILQGEAGAREMDMSTHAGAPLHRIAHAADNFSGSDLRELCRQAAYRPVRELIQAERKTGGGGNETVKDKVPRALQVKDFLDSIETSAPTRDAARAYHEKYMSSDSARARGAVPVVDIEAFLEALREQHNAGNSRPNDDDDDDVDDLE